MSRGPALGVPALSEPLSRERHRILHAVQHRLEEVAKTAVAVMRTEIPSYALQDERFFDDVRNQVLTHYRIQLAALAGGQDIAPEDLLFSRAAAMRRARAGFALEDWISAFRVGRQVLWDALLDCAGTSAEAQQAALSLVTPLMRYVDYASTHAAQAYVEYQQHVVADADRERRDLLDQLLAGAAPARGPLLATAQAYGIGPHSPMMAVVAVCIGDTHTGDLTSAESGYATSASLSVAGPWAGRTLVVVRHGEVVAVPVVRTGMDAEDICAHFEAVQRRLAREGTLLSMGISTVARGACELPRAYEEARAALDLVPGGGGVAALPRLSPFDYLALRADDLARQLVDPRVRALLEEDRGRGDMLAATIRAFAEADLNLRLAADRLRVHHNTAHYRLRRIEERTGRNPRRIADLLELLVALAIRDGAGEGGNDQ
ncbi:helix-turn-helix domain-containing protein [Streptomyces sp. PKU-EA00015]|uniref:PucR family transcriptional regulator n=1 Tax=Streptomyces sp. PKU-EA00015 TaxID=2748326 RepID=UPI0015A04749|nr:helix-turn-helix domain-containing protein [Streptomyces sp. PKU-EA00015]NWF25797.1 helix-turn-helix domain-containing protein [Streptomyces sp. PKU-EA00015]